MRPRKESQNAGRKEGGRATFIPEEKEEETKRSQMPTEKVKNNKKKTKVWVNYTKLAGGKKKGLLRKKAIPGYSQIESKRNRYKK